MVAARMTKIRECHDLKDPTLKESVGERNDIWFVRPLMILARETSDDVLVTRKRRRTNRDHLVRREI
ncbi:MAG: hypothetical protein HY459_01480 [Parcubacteria group bacterium]|nr:hypothetical protein [Parcubacteria group bacterium]